MVAFNYFFCFACISSTPVYNVLKWMKGLHVSVSAKLFLRLMGLEIYPHFHPLWFLELDLELIYIANNYQIRNWVWMLVLSVHWQPRLFCFNFTLCHHNTTAVSLWKLLLTKYKSNEFFLQGTENILEIFQLSVNNMNSLQCSGLQFTIQSDCHSVCHMHLDLVKHRAESFSELLTLKLWFFSVNETGLPSSLPGNFQLWVKEDDMLQMILCKRAGKKNRKVNCLLRNLQ